jgi:trk system potassium uptake protein TrkA
MKIIVVGGGNVAYYLARSFLSKGHSVVVINRDPAECRRAARQLKATIIHGDGSYPKVLEDAGAHDADAVLAMTANDEDNLVICQIAERRFQVPTTLAAVSDPDNESVFPQLGIKHVVSITRLVTSLIEERTSVEEIYHLVSLAEGKVNVTELELADDCPVLGQPLSQIGLPSDALIACIIRNERALVPHGGVSLMLGDRVILVTLPTSHGAAVKMLTGER